MMTTVETTKTAEDFWSDRYEKEGHIWGDDPSLTAELLTETLRPEDKLNNHTKLLEIGFGYGRDLVYFAEEGVTIYGIEQAVAGLTEATRQLSPYLNSGTATLQLGDFTKNDGLRGNFFDAVESHRMLHLVKPDKVKALVNKIAYVMKPGAWLAISARNPDDFNEEQMILLNPSTATYKDPKRAGHIINFWNEERFERAFSRQFNIVNYYHGQEIESQKNPVPSHFTIMLARKKTPEELNEIFNQNTMGRNVIPSTNLNGKKNQPFPGLTNSVPAQNTRVKGGQPFAGLIPSLAA